MKKVHILGIIIIAIAIGAILTTLSSKFHVVGKLNKEKEAIYDPHVNANLFSFYMIDNKGKECKVMLHKTKPQDFERSEQIVLIGKMQGDAFDATDILMKCPSKYNDGKPQETASK
jgi:cytochrome c-type biogenesis protein CcmE